jgi:hypothetical protein
MMAPMLTLLTSYHGVTAGMMAVPLLFVSNKEKSMEFGIARCGCMATRIALTGHCHVDGAIYERMPHPYSSLVQEKMT